MDTIATLLIADHSSNSALPDAHLLQEQGYHILRVDSGIQCLETARDTQPDLILASSHLPDMTGETLCRRIKTDPNIQPTPILLFSPLESTPKEQVLQAAADADGYIPLPIPFKDFLLRIKAMLQIKNISATSRTNAQEYREMLETSPLPYQSLDQNGCLVQVNRAWLEALGYENEKEVLGRSFGDFLDPESRTLFPERFQHFKKTGRICCVEFAMQHKTGVPVWVSFDGRIARNDEGAFKQTHCMFRDISAQKKLAQEKAFHPDTIMRPYFQAILTTFSLCALASGIYIFGFHDLSSPLVPMGLGLLAAILCLAGYLFLLFGRHIRKMIQFYIQEVDTREQSLTLLNENLEAAVDQKTRALSESEKKYRQYMEASPLALFVTSKTGRYLEANPTACELLGYTREEYLQLRIGDLTPSDQRARALKSFEEIRSTGATRGEYILKHKNGTHLHVSIEGVVLADIGYLAFCQDISERKKMEQELLRNKNRLEALITLSAMAHAPLHELTEFALETAVNLTKSDLGFLAFVNEDESALTMHSWSKKAMDQCSMKNPTTLFNAKDSGMWMESLRSRRPYICNAYNPLPPTRHGCPPGHIPITRHMNIPILDNGHICIIAGVANKSSEYDQTDSLHLTLLMQGMWDILKHRQHEETIRANEEQLRITLNSIGDGVIATDILGRVLTMNPVAEKLTGWPLLEGRGKKLGDLFTPLNIQDRSPLPDQVQAILLDKENMHLTNQSILLSKNGAEHQIAHSGAAIRDGRGSITGAVLVFRDVTEEYKTREELQRMHKLESIGTLAGGIAHDFNNILMGLFGSIELAKSQLPADQPAHASLERAEQSVDRAVRLSRQLLTFAKGGEPIKENVALRELVEEVARFDLAGSPVKPVFHTKDDLWQVDADKGQMQQIFSNLIINAGQAMPRGGKLYITLENTKMAEGSIVGLKKGNYVRIMFRDEGCGIEPADLDHIFDPYFTTKNTGSGLGLATVYAIVKKHAGHIGVNSLPEQGTTFTLHLPAAISHSEIQKDSPPPAESKEEQRAHILIMDDEEMIREVMLAMLQNLGYTGQTAPDGTQAITMYEKAWKAGTPFDAVIMDLTIPGGMGGKEAVKDILAIDPRARVIVSSGYADDPIMADYTRYGFRGMATKPFTLQKLQDVLHRILKK